MRKLIIGKFYSTRLFTMQRIRSVSYLISHILTRILWSLAMNSWYLVPILIVPFKWINPRFKFDLQAYHLQIMQGHMVDKSEIQSSFSFTAINHHVNRCTLLISNTNLYTLGFGLTSCPRFGIKLSLKRISDSRINMIRTC